MINQSRLHRRLNELSTIGRTKDGGITRFSYTKEEAAANKLVKSFMEEAGLLVEYDAVGNLIGTKIGRKPGYPAILLGSHIDTVPNGGKYDGALGVVAAIEVLHSMKENNVTIDHTIKIYSFKDEEGSRFGLGMIGSNAVAGTLTAQMLEKKDADGISVKQAMQLSGYAPDLIHEAQLTNVKLYLELHIEQGKILESQNASVGIVSGIAGPLWLKVILTGLSEHAGATPMDQRSDSLVGASLMISEIETITKKYPGSVATVGSIQVLPNGTNVIPGHTEFTIDLRHVSESVRNELEQDIRKMVDRIAISRELSYEIEELQRVAPSPCSKDIQRAIGSSIKEEGLPVITLPSGAGHDGMQFKNLWPIGMIFVRSKNGLSHNPKEFTSEEDIYLAAKVLYQTVQKLDCE